MKVNLKTVIRIIAKQDSVAEIYLFGSRGYNTGSKNSDIDILCVSKNALNLSEINSFLCSKYPSVDLFITYDKRCVNSCTNGSSITCNTDRYADIIEQLDAVLLWNSDGFNKSFKRWQQEISDYANFVPPSILPCPPGEQLAVRQALALVEKKLGSTPFFSGATHEEISETIIKLVDANLKGPSDKEIRTRAKGFSFNFHLDNEYDFQNFILLTLKPIFPDIEIESPTIKIDGSEKTADFSLIGSSIIIEAKWIDSQNKKAMVMKTLKGLSTFYSMNANVKSLIFLLLFENSVGCNFRKTEHSYSSADPAKPIYVRCFWNLYGKRVQ